MSAEECMKHTWLDPDNHIETVVISTDKLKKFIIRRKWQVRYLHLLNHVAWVSLCSCRDFRTCVVLILDRKPAMPYVLWAE